MLFHTTAAHIAEILAESNNKMILLDFYAPWCAPCRALEPVLDAFSEHHEDLVSAYSVNIDTDRELAERFDVSVLPTVLVLVNGEVIGRYEKDITAEALEKLF